jgi:hypothetical protein
VSGLPDWENLHLRHRTLKCEFEFLSGRLSGADEIQVRVFVIAEWLNLVRYDCVFPVASNETEIGALVLAANVLQNILYLVVTIDNDCVVACGTSDDAVVNGNV